MLTHIRYLAKKMYFISFIWPYVSCYSANIFDLEELSNSTADKFE